jgi:16S rRNA (guanine966-N2)-methyltransferase
MRILSGSVRGKKLLSPDELPLRPTCNKVRAAVFNIIRFQLKEANFLDLFAGTGAVGLSAISEGAASVTFVENNKKCLRALERNIKLSHFDEKTRLVNENVYKFLTWENLENYHFIFLDPPYDFLFDQYVNIFLLLHGKISKSCLVITEHTQRNSFEPFAREFNFTYDEKKYGKIKLSMMQRI